MGSKPGLQPVDEAEALRLLASVPYGRVAFILRGVQAIRPVNHLVDGRDVVIRTDAGAALTAVAARAKLPGVIVAYEADSVDADTHLGWSVVATGVAELVEDPEQVAYYRSRLDPWLDKQTDFVVRIEIKYLDGFVLTDTGGVYSRDGV